MITITLAQDDPTAAKKPASVFIPRLVGNDQTSFKGNQTNQVISFNLSKN
ncbi:MAG: hypothetical protein K0R10_2140 [Alphaproteobacteria bacterium]|nr:hypothetical protein [Alphaproteobacteria bacterium]